MKYNNTSFSPGSRININAAWEVNEWTRKWGVTRERLAAAIKEVGNKASEVEIFLKKGLKGTDNISGGTGNYSIL